MLSRAARVLHRVPWTASGPAGPRSFEMPPGSKPARLSAGPQVASAITQGMRLVGGSVALTGSGVLVFQSINPNESNHQISSDIPWVQILETKEGLKEVKSAGQMFRNHPIGSFILDQDHLMETLVRGEQVQELRCFYEKQARRFHSVVQFGRDVCGFPQTVHGGLTAAIIDETLGGLSVSLWRSGALGLQSPAYTARLEVDYKKKIPAGSRILCTAEVERIEGRKLWMRAQVTDGRESVYATARGLFVSPRLFSMKALRSYLSDFSFTSWLPRGSPRAGVRQSDTQKPGA